MKIKDMLIGIILIITIFFSYYFLKPIGQFTPVTKDNYSLNTYNISKENKFSSFRQEDNGTFYMHPGKDKASVGILTFKDAYNLSIDFWIQKGSKAGDIEFNITKNSIPINSLIVTTQSKKHLLITVEKGDKLKVEADKHGVTYQDLGKVQIKVQETLLTLKNFIIPFLWSILLIFLLNKKYKYVAITSYLLFILIIFAEKLNFKSISFQDLLVYTIFIFALSFSFVFIYQELSKLKKFKIATILSFCMAFLVYIIPLFFIIYALNFDANVTKDILFAVFQTNSNESYQYILSYISTTYIIFFILFTSIVGYLLYKQEKKETDLIEKSLLIFIIVSFFSISITQFSQLRLPSFLFNNANTYIRELTLFKYMQKQRENGEIKFFATKKVKGETYIFIIGESLSKRHMGLYGYFRNTTPKLSAMAKKDELVIFRNIYSNHTHTVPVLSLALTEANQYNKKSYYKSLSIIDILKEAGIETYWLTNQTIYGIHDNLVSIIGSSTDHLVAMNKHIASTDTNYLDAVLIKEVKKVLSHKTNKNRVIFVHLMGNHNYYPTRYPHDTYTKYKGKLKEGEFGDKASKESTINFYDNSVAYNDYVVSSIFQEAKKDKSVLAVMYMSDHGEDVINKLGHSSSNFTFYMTQIPMIAWFNNEYKKRYPHKYKNILRHSNILFSNDMLYDTLIGIFNIETDRYNPKYDFSSDKYVLKPEDALTLHGKKNYVDNTNHIYWQKVNAKYLVDTNQSNRIFPHQVDSIGKLKDIWNDGFRSFELDVRFSDEHTSSFIIGDNKEGGDVKFEDFITSVNYNKIKRIYLDFKNLNANNYTRVLKYLDYLNIKYHIKDKLIVGSGTTDSFFKNYREDGWHTSYCLPTGKILKMMKTKDEQNIKKLAIKIAVQSRIQNLAALSYDQKVYPFVKKFLEPLIDENIVYHIRYTPALKNSNFKKKLIENIIYKDSKVKTFLFPYNSQFNMSSEDNKYE